MDDACDRNDLDEALPAEFRQAIETNHDEIVDLHVRQPGPGRHGAIISILGDDPNPVRQCRTRLRDLHDLVHVTIEVHGRPV